MDSYFINKNPQENGDHEVHKWGCSWLEKVKDKEALGVFDNCHVAIKEAKKLGYKTADGCYYCCRLCHKQ